MTIASETLWSRWLHHAELDPDRESICFLRAGEAPRRSSRGELIVRAKRYAAWLAANGVEPGDTCALIIRHHPEFYALYMGVVALGGVPAVLAYPNARLHPDKFESGLVGMAQRSGLDWILSETALADVLHPLLERSPIAGLLCPLDADLPEQQHATSTRDAGSAALLQHSSGTTGLQKAVVLSHQAVLRHVDDYGRAIAVNAGDRVVSWLPLYHDMGLIAAFHLPLALGVPSVQLDPFEWVAAPVLWVEAMANEGGTLSWLPNFAYSLMGARVHDDDLQGMSLAHVRLLINCSEPVRQHSHTALLEKLGPIGLPPECLGASYAMAETTFAITQTMPGRGCSSEVAEDSQRVCISSGRALPDCEVRIVDGDGATLPAQRVGEILVRSPAMFSGYRNNPEETQRVLRDGWYWTGDLGFTRDGEVFVVGRKKDLIIVAGRNLYPEDIEDTVGEVQGVLPGRCVAFGREDATLGTERVCVIVESELEAAEHPALRMRVIAAGQNIDVTISEAHIMPPRWLIKSSSGKPSRSANRDRIAAGRTA